MANIREFRGLILPADEGHPIDAEVVEEEEFVASEDSIFDDEGFWDTIVDLIETSVKMLKRARRTANPRFKRLIDNHIVDLEMCIDQFPASGEDSDEASPD